jgi:hypothetical protein
MPCAAGKKLGKRGVAPSPFLQGSCEIRATVTESGYNEPLRSSLQRLQEGGMAQRRGGAAPGIALLLAASSGPAAFADVYTRVNSKGVLEATNVPASTQGFKLAYRSKGLLVHSVGFQPGASPNHEFDHHIDAASALHGVSRALIRAIIQAESAFDSLAVSTAGARGLMQLMPATARRFGVADSFDPRQNIFAGTRYLRILLDAYGGDVSLAAAAYNAGEQVVARYNGIPPYPETRDYVRRVNALLGAAEALGASVIPAMFITPGDRRPSTAAIGSPASPTTRRPRVYYKWKDEKGVVHMEQAPPSAGSYTTIRGR